MLYRLTGASQVSWPELLKITEASLPLSIMSQMQYGLITQFFLTLQEK